MQNITNRNQFHPQNWRQIARREGLPDDEIVVIIDKSVLKVFRRNVYCLAVAFCLVTVTPWTIIEAVDYKFTSLWNIPFYIWLFMAFFCQAMLACFPQTRYTPPCNWILVLLVVLLLTMFGSYFLYLISIETFLVALLTASVVLAVLHVCGAYCPQVVLPNTVCTGCVLLVCLITLLVDGLLLLMMVDPIYRLVFCIVIFTLVLMMIPFNSQYINGRLKFTPIADTLVCALAIYTHFIIMLLCLCAFKYYFDFYIDQVYGMPHDELITYTTRIYGLGFMFALIGLVQWIVIAALDFRVEKLTADRYGWWLACTFFAIATLAWTEFGRKFPINIALIVGIVETSTWYIGFEQSFIQNHLADFYALVIVVSIMFCSIFWGAYFPMYIVPGDLVLSVLVATANIMLFIFFFNAYITGAEAIEVAVRNFFAIFAISMVIYTATIVHDRQFNVPKHEYLFLSVIIFFCYMILQERVLALSYEYSNDMECTSMINETY